MQQLNLSLQSTDLCIRRSIRAKRLRVTINSVGDVEVVAPRKASINEINRFVNSQYSWIEQRKNQLDTLRGSELNIAMPVMIKLPALSENWNVLYQSGPKKIEFDRKNVTSASTLCLTMEHESQTGELLKSWLGQKAKLALLPWLNRISDETGLPFNNASVRGQRTRWGSCSIRKNISLNRCMLFLKPEQVRYLMVHELCHTREMNHSVRFWQLVSQYVPDYKTQEKLVNECCYKLPKWAF